MDNAICRYVAADGQQVELSPLVVAKQLVIGNEQISDKDAARVMAICQARRMNPLAGDCYVTIFKGKCSVMASKDYFLRRARSNPDFDGMESGIVVVDRNGNFERRPGTLYGPKTEKLVGGWARVYVKCMRVPFYSEVSLQEYDGKNTMWSSKPATMISKVAVSQCLRTAFPNDFSGVYEREEMDQAYVKQPVMRPQEPPQASVQVQPAEVPAMAEPEQGDMFDRYSYDGANDIEPTYEP